MRLVSAGLPASRLAERLVQAVSVGRPRPKRDWRTAGLGGRLGGRLSARPFYRPLCPHRTVAGHPVDLEPPAEPRHRPAGACSRQHPGGRQLLPSRPGGDAARRLLDRSRRRPLRAPTRADRRRAGLRHEPRQRRHAGSRLGDLCDLRDLGRLGAASTITCPHRGSMRTATAFAFRACSSARGHGPGSSIIRRCRSMRT